MKKHILILTVLMVAASAMAGTWIKIKTDGAGAAVGKVTISTTRPYTPDPAKNEYPVDTQFPEVDMEYWKKSGNNWVEMTQAEKDVVDEALKEEGVDEATEDAQLDAIIRAVAENVNGLTYEKLKADVKKNIDPKKQKNKKDKGKK